MKLNNLCLAMRVVRNFPSTWYLTVTVTISLVTAVLNRSQGISSNPMMMIIVGLPQRSLKIGDLNMMNLFEYLAVSATVMSSVLIVGLLFISVAYGRQERF